MSNPWVIELLSPPGHFIAREYSEFSSQESLGAHIQQSHAELPLWLSWRTAKGESLTEPPPLDELSKRSQWTLMQLPDAKLAQGLTDFLNSKIPDPSPPWDNELNTKFRVAVDSFLEALKARF